MNRARDKATCIEFSDIVGQPGGKRSLARRYPLVDDRMRVILAQREMEGGLVVVQVSFELDAGRLRRTASPHASAPVALSMRITDSSSSDTRCQSKGEMGRYTMRP